MRWELAMGLERVENCCCRKAVERRKISTVTLRIFPMLRRSRVAPANGELPAGLGLPLHGVSGAVSTADDIPSSFTFSTPSQ